MPNFLKTQKKMFFLYYTIIKFNIKAQNIKELFL